ncbi:WXG100 family type VII secretion target [Actinoplanes sp. NBRC 103695]|uniref:WXG100 family type VII secretion target n=1 Tax=Actinoplanes sp. NBRC 103695 TaxID=3032202 RepID=UPI0024A3E159|nr:WXG100 family type VII secretion target [Actinoplanes sp. NBRC 103695]GLY97589.1 hypothetical protein Acsp02_48430 [Actinoplanes sp. NBRC 103695]
MGAEDEQIHGVVDTMGSAAQMASSVSDAINGHHTALMTEVANLRGQWEGTARGAFEGVAGEISDAIVGLRDALTDLGVGVGQSADGYLGANDDVTSTVNRVDVPAFEGRTTVRS